MILLFCESGVLARTREYIYLLFTKGEEEKVLNCDISFCLTSRSKLASEIAIFHIFYIISSNVHASKFRQFFFRSFAAFEAISCNLGFSFGSQFLNKPSEA